MLLLEAIAKQEGFYDTLPNRPKRNNNPGDLEWRPWQAAFHGSHSIDPRFTKFDTVVDGFRALQHLLTFPAYFGMTLKQVFNTYAPPVENQTNVYLSNVCKWTSLTPETILTHDLLLLPGVSLA